jgi:putative hemolysin
MEVVSSLWFNTYFTLGRVPHMLKLNSLQDKIISPTVQIDIDHQYYQIKTANTHEELAEVLSLRFEVFFREFSTNKVTFSLFPYDVDVYDFICDHLIIKDKASNKIVACYRLLSSQVGKKFYSENEFDLSNFINSEGEKLELGRACVHKDYRKGTVIALLWRGLLEYAKKSNTRYMFGCSSINRKDFPNIPRIVEWLDQNQFFINELDIKVKNKYKLKDSLEVEINNSTTDKSGTKVLGSLMHSYIMAGARMGRPMAYDAEMDCIDFFTLIDLNLLPPSFERRFTN